MFLWSVSFPYKKLRKHSPEGNLGGRVMNLFIACVKRDDPPQLMVIMGAYLFVSCVTRGTR